MLSVCSCMHCAACTTVLSVCVQVTDNKQRISELKGAIEQRRVQRSMSSLADPAAAQAPQEPDPVEEQAKAQIEQVGHDQQESCVNGTQGGACWYVATSPELASVSDG